MAQIPIRRAQMIAPFGPGAMMVTQDSVSIIAAGIDQWFKQEEDKKFKIDLDEFKILEWRLQRELGVDHFRLPPDFRYQSTDDQKFNMYLKIPFLRFPRYHHCRSCHGLFEMSLNLKGKVKCPDCLEKKGFGSKLVQVRFIAMCDHGHVQDFPWREWVHYSANPSCHKRLRLKSTGGTGLGSIRVSCDCKAQRSLEGIMTASRDGTTMLSKRLEAGESQYLCQGHRPWLGTEEPEGCGRPLRGSLRSASNVYFAQVKSALYLPNQTKDASKLIRLLCEETYREYLEDLLDSTRHDLPEKERRLRRQYQRELSDFSSEEVVQTLEFLKVHGFETETGSNQTLLGDLGMRHEEYQILQNEMRHDELVIKKADLSEYEEAIRNCFSRVMLVEKLKETRVLYGFRRVNAIGNDSIEQLKALLRRNPHEDDANWLPAYNVYGEGIFLQLREEWLAKWESRVKVQERVRDLQNRAKCQGTFSGQPLNARFVLMHTLAHLLINQLTFDCGYSSTALRERLYVSDHPDTKMNGILIYTAAGDSDGTMGGLVRMGKAGHLEPIFQKAIANARWCSSDPVCMEVGGQGGQGPESLNLAACHSCCLVPETACEEFNRYLDRALVVGNIDCPDLGWFQSSTEPLYVLK